MLALTACPPATRSGDVHPRNQCVGEGGRFVSTVQLQILVLEGRVSLPVPWKIPGEGAAVAEGRVESTGWKQVPGRGSCWCCLL